MLAAITNEARGRAPLLHLKSRRNNCTEAHQVPAAVHHLSANVKIGKRDAQQPHKRLEFSRVALGERAVCERKEAQRRPILSKEGIIDVRIKAAVMDQAACVPFCSQKTGDPHRHRTRVQSSSLLAQSQLFFSSLCPLPGPLVLVRGSARPLPPWIPSWIPSA